MEISRIDLFARFLRDILIQIIPKGRPAYNNTERRQRRLMVILHYTSKILGAVQG